MSGVHGVNEGGGGGGEGYNLKFLKKNIKIFFLKKMMSNS